MTFWQKNKWKIIAPVLIVLVLAATFVFGDRNMPKQKDPAEQTTVAAPAEAPEQPTADAPVQTPEQPAATADVPDDAETEPTEAPTESAPEPSDKPQTDEPAQTDTEQPEYVSPEEIQANATGEYEEVNGMLIDTGTHKDKYQTDPVPEGKPIPVEPEDVEIGNTEYTCTLSISCATILDNMDWLDPEKVELVPEDGVIFPTTTVTFYEGESVFNVLQREMRKAGIHMEFEDTPMYNSAYIEGINNLYEFDCGELSGWMYKVNGWFPNYGCSRYQLKEGDVIEWVYTCDLGVDVGGFYSTGE